MTGPLLALELDRGQPLGLQIERRLRALDPDRRPSGRRAGCPRRVRSRRTSASRAASSSARTRSSRRRVHRASPRRRARRRCRRSRARTTCASSRTSRSRVRATTCARPAGLRALPAVAVARREPGGAAAARRTATSPTASRSARRELRRRLAPFLARTRGVVAAPERTGVFAGSTQALHVLASVLRARGRAAHRVEDPGHRWRDATLAASGLEVVPVRGRRRGLCVDELPRRRRRRRQPRPPVPARRRASPPERRRALVDWAASGTASSIEHDYDGHFRYDRPPAGALQALAPEHVAYVGTRERAARADAPPRLGGAAGCAWSSPVAHACSRTRRDAAPDAARARRVHRARLSRPPSAPGAQRRTGGGELARRRARGTVPGRGRRGPPSASCSRSASGACRRGAARRGSARGASRSTGSTSTASPQPPGLVARLRAAPEPTLGRGVELIRAAWNETVR